MRRHFVGIFFLLIIGLSLSCMETEERAVARIGDNMITVAMLQREYLAITPESRPELRTIDEKEQFARDVISKEILEAEARKSGLDKLPEVVEAGKAATQRKAWQLFYEEQVRSKVEVSEEQIRELYAKQRYAYDLAWIFLRSKALAEEVSRRIKAGEDFGKLASIYSMDASKERQGAIGSRPLGTMPGSVEDIVMQMPPGQVTDPIPYETYYVLIKLNDKQEMELPEFESARESLTSMARTRMETARQREMVKELKAKYGLTFNYDVVDFIAAETAALYTSEDVEPGLIPEFSDEELDRTIAQYEGGEWRVATYVEKMKMQNVHLRPGYGADREVIESVISDFITGELWRAEIENEGYNQRPDVMKLASRAMEEAIVTAMHQDLIRGVEVDEDMLKGFYEEQKAEMVTDPGARLAIITLDTEEEAEEVYRQLQSGSGFEDLAREKSVDRATGAAGGSFRSPLYKRQLEQFPDIEELVESLNVGGYSRPVPVPMGFVAGQFAIIKVLEKMDSRQLAYDEVKEMLSQRVLELEQDKVFGEWLAGKLEEYEVEIYPDVLGAMDFMELKEQEA